MKPVRTNATGASSGGGSVATSGGGTSHSHSVSGQSASAGGGQTSSTESTHTHAVSGQTAAAAGAHRHQMFAAVGSGPAATSSVPDVASTQFESATHYHNGTGSSFPNAGSHSHSLNSHRHTVTNYQVAGKNSTGAANVSFWMILPDGQAFSPVYTYEAAVDHSHAVSATTSGAGASHAHTVADHTHAVSGTTSSAETSHTHSVTLPSHTHSLVFGIYEGAGPTASANVTVTINGVDRTATLGGPFDGDFLAKDITAYLQDGQGQPLRQRNVVVFTAGELLDLEIVCKSLVYFTEEGDDMELRARVERLERLIGGNGVDDEEGKRLTGEDALAWMDGRGFSLLLGLAQTQAAISNASTGGPHAHFATVEVKLH